VRSLEVPLRTFLSFELVFVERLVEIWGAHVEFFFYLYLRVRSQLEELGATLVKLTITKLLM
jgi:hypothetical protein